VVEGLLLDALTINVVNAVIKTASVPRDERMIRRRIASGQRYCIEYGPCFAEWSDTIAF